MTAPHVSVLMPAFNSGRFIRAAIESVCTQSFKDLELVVVDDGSTDDTLQIATDYPDDRVRAYANETHLGVGATRNRCLSLANGSLIAWMDSDDLSLPTRLAEQVAYLHKHSSIGVVGTDLIPRDEDTGRYGSPWAPPLTPAAIRWGFLFGTPLFNGTTMVRREVYANCGNYQEDLLISEDNEFWLRCSTSVSMANLSKVLLVYRRHASNTTVTAKEDSITTGLRLTAEALERLTGIEVSLQTARLLRPSSLPPQMSVARPTEAIRVLELAQARFDRMTSFDQAEERELKRLRSVQRLQVCLFSYGRGRYDGREWMHAWPGLCSMFVGLHDILNRRVRAMFVRGLATRRLGRLVGL